jgi:hypothetical protein
MTDITGQDIINAYDQAMDNTAPIMTRVLGVLINDVSFRPTGNLAGQTTTSRNGDIIQSKSNAFYWKWWLEGRPAIVPVRAKYLHFFIDGQEVFTKYVKPFKGHRDAVEPLYQKEVTQILDNQLTKSFGEL